MAKADGVTKEKAIKLSTMISLWLLVDDVYT
jgi:hypothetical protein